MDSLDQIHLRSNSIVGNIDTIYSAMTNLINQYFYNGILEKKTRGILIWWRKRHTTVSELCIQVFPLCSFFCLWRSSLETAYDICYDYLGIWRWAHGKRRWLFKINRGKNVWQRKKKDLPFQILCHVLHIGVSVMLSD